MSRSFATSVDDSSSTILRNSSIMYKQQLKFQEQFLLLVMLKFVMLIGQVVEVFNPPQDVSFCILKENEVKMVRPRHITNLHW